MVTKSFMLGVKDKHYWCLRSSEVTTLKQCADPPSKKDLATILAGVMNNMNPLGEPMDSGLRNTAQLILTKPPSIAWMITLLSTLHPDNVIFGKDYVKPRVERKALD